MLYPMNGDINNASQLGISQAFAKTIDIKIEEHIAKSIMSDLMFSSYFISAKQLLQTLAPQGISELQNLHLTVLGLLINYHLLDF
jgi:hypothetical protein